MAGKLDVLGINGLLASLIDFADVSADASIDTDLPEMYWRQIEALAKFPRCENKEIVRVSVAWGHSPGVVRIHVNKARRERASNPWSYTGEF
jgi:hypothetical protein